MAEKLDLSNLEDILMNSLPEELEELNEYFNSSELISEHGNKQYKCEKQPTGPLDLEKLRKFMEDTAMEEEDWPERVPYVSKVKAVPEEAANDSCLSEDAELDETIREALAQCDEQDLAELSAILGVSGPEVPETKQPVLRAPPQPAWEEEINPVDVAETLAGLERNSPDLVEVNLNNVQDLTVEDMGRLTEALRGNTHLKTLSLCAVRLSSAAGRALGQALRDNHTLLKLNLSSNCLSGAAVVDILESINYNKTLLELRLCNQCQQNLGSSAENAMLRLVMDNPTLKVLSADLAVPAVRFGIQKRLQENCFRGRKR